MARASSPRIACALDAVACGDDEHVGAPSLIGRVAAVSGAAAPRCDRRYRDATLESAAAILDGRWPPRGPRTEAYFQQGLRTMLEGVSARNEVSRAARASARGPRHLLG